MTTNDYQAAVAAYAGELRILFAPDPTGTRAAEIGALSGDTLADRADRLAERSADLLDQTEPLLNAEDPNVQLGAEQSLLAQAAASLRVAEGLLAADADLETAGTRAAAQLAESVVFDDLLAVIEAPLATLGGALAAEQVRTRSTAVVSPEDLVQSANNAIDQVLSGVGSFGQDAVTGMLGLDTALLRQAAQLLGGELGQQLEKLGSQVSLLVTKAVRFLLQAYDSLLAAMGEDIAGALRQQVAGWIAQLQEGGALTQMIDAALQVAVVRNRVAEVVAASQAPAAVLEETRAQIQALPDSFHARTRLAGQLLAGMALLKRIPAARLPMVELATAAVYIGLLGFVVYTGGDYVDAPRLERIGRVTGVLQVVEAGLA